MKCRVLRENIDPTMQPCPGATKKIIQIENRPCTLWFLTIGSMEALRELAKKYPQVDITYEPRKWQLNLILHG